MNDTFVRVYDVFAKSPQTVGLLILLFTCLFIVAIGLTYIFRKRR